MITISPLSGGFIRLTHLPSRVCGIGHKIETDDEEMQRLKMFGVCAGRRMELVHGDDPLILKAFGSRPRLAALAVRLLIGVANLRCWVSFSEPKRKN